MKRRKIASIILFACGVFTAFTSAGIAQELSPETEAPTSEETVKPIERILVLGDSHSMGHFGRTLHKKLRAKYPNAKVTLVAACGKGEGGFLSGGYAHCGVITLHPKGGVSRPKGCKKNPCTEADGPECTEQNCRPRKLRAQLRRSKPDLVILQMGSNSWFKGSMTKGWGKVEKRVEKIAAHVRKRNAKCLWVTPPDSSKRSSESQDAFAAMYERVLEGKCSVFNSRPSHHPYMDYAKAIEAAGKKGKRNDGTHYGTLGATGKQIEEQWVQDILLQLEQPFPSL